jgi:hypothetical protein
MSSKFYTSCIKFYYLNASLSTNNITASSILLTLLFVFFFIPFAYIISNGNKFLAIFEFGSLLLHRSALLIGSAKFCLTKTAAVLRTLASIQNSLKVDKTS